MLLLIVWFVAAAFATVGKIFDAPPPVGARRGATGLPLLAAYAMIGPVPTAVGRWLFAPELRDAAAGLQGNEVALRLAALWTPVTGLLLPVRGDRRHRRLDGLSVVAAAGTGRRAEPRPGRAADADRAAGLADLDRRSANGSASSSTASPQERGAFPLRILGASANRTRLGSRQPAETVAISGFSCKTVTTYQGYRQVASQNVPATLSPVRAQTPEGAEISGRFVAAQYDDVIVVAGSDRLSSEADQVFGLGVRDGSQRWHFQCGSPARTP